MLGGGRDDQDEGFLEYVECSAKTQAGVAEVMKAALMPVGVIGCWTVVL